MAIIDFKCPECKEKNNFALMGNDKGIFDRKCKACNTKLEIENNSDGIQVKSLQKNIKRKPPTRHAEEIQEREDNNVPTDYKKYKLGIPNKKTAKFIAILILTSSLMGLFTGYAIIDFFNSDFDEFENVEIIEILVKKGDKIKKNDSIITLESDKSSVEVPSTCNGIIDSVNVKIGDKVSKGDLILLVQAEGKNDSEKTIPEKEQKVPNNTENLIKEAEKTLSKKEQR
ncbi:MAG TPA: biotin/lipoyl-containing protein, partial [Candidatus Poseidoniia archaeon]|nr:biotin/lipoyl-containing protein [Candidatus Poseidoniia archaeon]